MSLEDFLKACVEVGAWNLTYDARTAALVKSAQLEVPQPLDVPDKGFEDWFATRLDSAGFRTRRLGPEDLRTIQVLAPE